MNKVRQILSDPLLRNFFSGSLFAIAFIWAAIYFFDVDFEIIKTLMVLAFLFVGTMVIVGFILFPLVLLLRKKRGTFIQKKEKGKSVNRNISEE